MPSATPGGSRLQGHGQIFPAQWMLRRDWSAASQQGAKEGAGPPQNVTLLARRTNLAAAGVLRKKWSKFTCWQVNRFFNSESSQKYSLPPDDKSAGRKRGMNSIAGDGSPKADCVRVNGANTALN